MAIRPTVALANLLNQGYGLRDLLRDMTIYGYSGSQPVTADTAPTTSPLVIFTLAKGAFTGPTRASATIVLSGTTGTIDTIKVGGAAYNLLSSAVAVTSGDLGTSADNVAANINARENPNNVVAVSDSVDTITLYLPYWYGALGNGLTLATTQTTSTVTPASTFTGGVTAVNGLNFSFPAALGVIDIPSGESWSGLGLLAGTIGWFRAVRGGSLVAGSGATEVRFDGSVATSGGDLSTGSLAIEVGAEQVITSLTITQSSSSA